MASQSFSFDWLKEKTANLNIEIDSIELLKSCILIVGGRGLDDNKKKILVVDAVTSTVLAEFVEKQTKDANILRLQYLAHQRSSCTAQATSCGY
jgi:RecA/RadA recombinase